MKLGHFDDARREYVITTPDTPLPWINYLGSETFFSIISHQAGGYCFYRDARLRRLLRYRYNNVPADTGGRYFYLRDADGGDLWTPTFAPCRKPLDAYECRHGLGYTRITGRRGDVEASQLHLVPLGQTAEICQLTLRNHGPAPKTVQVFSFVEWCLWNAHDDATNYQRNLSTGEVEIESAGQTLYHVTEYRERRDHFAFFHVNQPVDGFDTDRDTFLGRWRGFDAPEVPTRGAAGGSVARGWSPIASHALAVTLPPGGARDLVFVLGYVENDRGDKWEAAGVVNKRRAHDLIAAFSRPEQVEAAQVALAASWSHLLGSFQITSPDPRFDRMVNVWNAYQCMVTFNLSRSASSFEVGIGRGMGFRDSNQDLLGVVQMIPERARQRLVDLASTQRPDGSAWHQYQPLTKKGNADIGSGFNDDPVWLVMAVDAYVRETGDLGLLRETVPFDGGVDPHATMFEHLKRSMDHVAANRGPHGLPLIGRADWNDCLNLNCFSETPDESFQTTSNREGRTAESIFIAALFLYAAPGYAALARSIGQRDEAARIERHASEIARAVDAHGRDAEWFLRAYDFFGAKVGSASCEEGQIFIEPQGFCVMAGLGVVDGFARRALDAVKERLDTPYGIVLQQPPYRRYHVELGEISSYPPGYKENAGIFCHNNPWIAIAETVVGRADRAFDAWKKIAPSYLEDIAELHRTEPYVYSQMIAGKDAARPGEAKNSWLTGTAAWNFVAATQHLVGVRPEHGGLRVRPCLPRALGALVVRRRCRGVDYEIHITNHATGRPPELSIEGRRLPGDLVPFGVPGSKVVVTCHT